MVFCSKDLLGSNANKTYVYAHGLYHMYMYEVYYSKNVDLVLLAWSTEVGLETSSGTIASQKEQRAISE